MSTRPVRSRPGYAVNPTSPVGPEAPVTRTDERAARPDDAPPFFDVDAPPARRTVTIMGRGAERNLWALEAGRRRPARRPHERAGFQPDRVALWAVFLGMLLLFVAAASAHI